MSVWAAYRQLLSNRPLSMLLLAEFVSSVGDGMYFVALFVLVYAETSDPVILGLVGFGILLPKLFLSIPAGMITDRIDRRVVLLVSDIGCAACMIVLTILVALDAPILAIAAVTILAACFSTFFTPAFGALLPSLVRDETEFGPANSAWATLDNFAWVFGPAVAGALLIFGNVELAFLLNAGSYVLVVFVVWSLPRSKAVRLPRVEGGAAESGEREPRRRRLRPKLPASINARAVAGVLVLNASAWLAYGGMTILLVVIAIDVLRAGPAATGYLNVALGAGGAIGALLSGVLVLRPRLAPALLLSGAAASAATFLLGIAPILPIALLAVAITSAGQMVLDVAMTTVYQRVVPDEYRGRFTGAMVTSSTTAEAGGTLVIPVLASVVGVGYVLGGLGVLLFVATMISIVLIGRAGDVVPGEFDAELRRIARMPIFGGLPVAKLEAALRRLEPIRVEAGTVVVRQGEPADRFYIVEHGRFEVTGRTEGGGERRLNILEGGTVFGERGLLTRKPRAATVTSLAPGLIFAMDGASFVELVASRQGTAERFLALYARPDEPGDAPALS